MGRGTRVRRGGRGGGVDIVEGEGGGFRGCKQDR